MRHGQSGNPDQSGNEQHGKSERHDAVDAIAGDQAAGDEAGAYIPSTCHWMPNVASVTEWPQPTMASGADVITRFINV